jgi:hypothetical protein
LLGEGSLFLFEREGGRVWMARYRVEE